MGNTDIRGAEKIKALTIKVHICVTLKGRNTKKKRPLRKQKNQLILEFLFLQTASSNLF
jgi:hypothetical protein